MMNGREVGLTVLMQIVILIGKRIILNRCEVYYDLMVHKCTIPTSEVQVQVSIGVGSTSSLYVGW